MSNNVHITRKINGRDGKGPTISLEEWLACVDGDPEMKRESGAEAPVGDRRKTVRAESEGMATWTRYSGDGVARNHAWFSYDREAGIITVSRPDKDIRSKMHVIAMALRARVQGDEGECYGPTGSELPPEEKEKKSWWKWR